MPIWCPVCEFAAFLIHVFVAGRCIGTLKGHDDEVLDVAFDYTGQYLLTASADGTARCYNAVTQNLVSKLEGHEGEISKVKLINLKAEKYDLYFIVICRIALYVLYV